MKRDTKNVVRTILVLFATAAVLIFALSVAFSAVAAPSMQEVPLQGGLDTDQCDADNDGWHFIATRTDASQVAGSFVWIVHDDSQHAIPLDRLTGQSAHYLGTEHGLDAGIVSATLHIAQGWDGRFVLSHPPCGYVHPTPTPTETVPPGECPSNHHGCTPPPPRPTPTETPTWPTETPSPSPSDSTSPEPSPTSEPSPTDSTPSEPTPTAPPSTTPPSPTSATPSPAVTSAPTGDAATAAVQSPPPPSESSTLRSELAATGVSAWLLGAGAVVLSVLGAAFATYGGRMEGRR